MNRLFKSLNMKHILANYMFTKKQHFKHDLPCYVTKIKMRNAKLNVTHHVNKKIKTSSFMEDVPKVVNSIP